MANIKGGAIKAQQTQPQVGNPLMMQLKSLIEHPNTKKHFEQMLGKHSGAFLGSITTLASQNGGKILQCLPKTIMGGAIKAASLGFSLDPAIGQCFLVPYFGKEGNVAQFQIGYKGWIELFQRSDKAAGCRMFPVYEGEVNDWNKFTETFTPGARVSDVIIGFYAAFELKNGFKKAEFWTKEAVVAHALKTNPMCKKAGKLVGIWESDFEVMGSKTVLKHILSVYAPKSIEMQQALTADEKTFSVDDKGDVVDVEEPIDIEFDDTIEVQDGQQ